MNCERVFQILTRGPFPTGKPVDYAVESHLAYCPSCRRLASALQPALELFEEAVAPEESRDLPAYWGELFSVKTDAATPGTDRRGSTMIRRLTRTQKQRSNSSRWWTNAGRFLAAVLVGAALGLTFHNMGVGQGTSSDDGKRPSGSSVAAAKDADMPREHIVRFASLELASACRAPSATRPTSEMPSVGMRSPSSLGRLDAQQCCTECHHAGSPITTSRVAQQAVEQSCRYCHN